MNNNDRLDALEIEVRELKESVLVALRATQRLDEILREQAALAEKEHEHLTVVLDELSVTKEQQPEPEPERQRRWRKA